MSIGVTRAHAVFVMSIGVTRAHADAPATLAVRVFPAPGRDALLGDLLGRFDRGKDRLDGRTGSVHRAQHRNVDHCKPRMNVD